MWDLRAGDGANHHLLRSQSGLREEQAHDHMMARVNGHLEELPQGSDRMNAF